MSVRDEGEKGEGGRYVEVFICKEVAVWGVWLNTSYTGTVRLDIALIGKLQDRDTQEPSGVVLNITWNRWPSNDSALSVYPE